MMFKIIIYRFWIIILFFFGVQGYWRITESDNLGISNTVAIKYISL